MAQEMDSETFRAAFEAEVGSPSPEKLIRRFRTAFQGSDGDASSAMAAVNEVLAKPVTYETFMRWLSRAA